MSDSPFPGAGGGWPPFTRSPADAPPSAFAPQGNPWTAVPPWNTMVEPWLQIMRLWSDGAAMFTGPMGMANPFAPMMAPATRPTVSVRVQSTRATEVALDLSPGATGSDLTVRRLLSTDGARVATLEGVTVTGQAGHYTVNVAVPDDQEPGSYAGPVENAHQQRVGEVRVIISGAAKGRTAGDRSAKSKAKAKTKAKAKVPARTAAKKARTPRPKGPPRAPGKR